MKNRKDVTVFALNITSHGYGVGPDRAYAICEKLSPDELRDLAYLCYRTAEKCSPDAFDTEEKYRQ